jgi:hypothetical protein
MRQLQARGDAARQRRFAGAGRTDHDDPHQVPSNWCRRRMVLR